MSSSGVSVRSEGRFGIIILGIFFLTSSVVKPIVSPWFLIFAIAFNWSCFDGKDMMTPPFIVGLIFEMLNSMSVGKMDVSIFLLIVLISPIFSLELLADGNVGFSII